MIKHTVIDHLAPKVTVGNHLHFEHRWLGRNTDCWFCFNPSKTLTSNTQPAALYKRYRDGDREEKKKKERNGEGVTEMH